MELQIILVREESKKQDETEEQRNHFPVRDF